MTNTSFPTQKTSIPSITHRHILQCKKSSKAQIKFAETIAILFIFFILLGIGFVFYARFASISASQDISAAQDLRAVEITQAISFLSELACTEFGVIESGCFDLNKVYSLAAVGVGSAADPNLRAYYINTFGNAKISVRSIYPPGEEVFIYDNPKQNFTLASASFYPIALKNTSMSNTYLLGVLSVTVYQ